MSAFCLLTHKIMIEALSLLAVVLIGTTLWHVSRMTEHANDPSIQPTGEGVPSTVPPEFQALLDTYSSNYISYGTNQDAGSQQAYMTAQKGIDEAIAALQTKVDNNKQVIQTFLSDNPDTNAIESLHSQSQDLQSLRPKLEDQQKLLTQQTAPAPGNMSVGLMLKAGLLLVFTVLGGVISVL